MAEAHGAPETVARVLDRALADDPDREALVTRLAPPHLRRARPAGRPGRPRPRATSASAPATGWRRRLPNDADVVVAFHGAMRLGAVWVGVNRALAPPEKRYLLDDSGATLLLCDDELARPRRAGGRPGRLAGGRRRRGRRPGRRRRRPATPRPASPTPAAPPATPRARCTASTTCCVPGAVLVETRGYGPDAAQGRLLPVHDPQHGRAHHAARVAGRAAARS